MDFFQNNFSFFYTNTFLECVRFCSKRPRYLGPYTQIVVRVHFVCSENRTLKRLLQITGSFYLTRTFIAAVVPNFNLFIDLSFLEFWHYPKNTRKSPGQGNHEFAMD